MKQILPWSTKVLAFLIIGVIPLVGVYLLGTESRQAQATPTGSLTADKVDIPISKTQMTTEGQPLKEDQWIQISVYVPKDDGNGLSAKVSTYAVFVSQNEGFVILSVPEDQAASLEEALLTENAKVIYHEIDDEPEPPATPAPLVTTPIPTPMSSTVQIKIPVQNIQGGISSLTEKMKVRLVVVERLAVYHVDSEPITTYEPSAPVDACAFVKGFMLKEKDGLINKDEVTPEYVLVELPTANASEIARALTNASNVYLLPVSTCSLKP